MKIYLSYILRSISLIVLAGIFFACNDTGDSTNNKIADPDQQAQTTVFDKLTGTWQSENGKNFERWKKNSDGTYQSAGFSVKGNDTSWNERATVYKEKDTWVFENIVKGQNEGKAVKFIATYVNENSVQFSNPAHDFPTDVNYTISDINTLIAFIVGPNNKGGKDTIPFNFKRVN